MSNDQIIQELRILFAQLEALQKEHKDISGNSFSKKMSYELLTEIVNNALRIAIISTP